MTQPNDIRQAEEAACEAHLLLCGNKNCSKECNPSADKKVSELFSQALSKTRQEAEAAGYERGRAEGDKEGAGRVVAAVRDAVNESIELGELGPQDRIIFAAARAAASGEGGE